MKLCLYFSNRRLPFLLIFTFASCINAPLKLVKMQNSADFWCLGNGALCDLIYCHDDSECPSNYICTQHWQPMTDIPWLVLGQSNPLPATPWQKVFGTSGGILAAGPDALDGAIDALWTVISPSIRRPHFFHMWNSPKCVPSNMTKLPAVVVPGGGGLFIPAFPRSAILELRNNAILPDQSYLDVFRTDTVLGNSVNSNYYPRDFAPISAFEVPDTYSTMNDYVNLSTSYNNTSYGKHEGQTVNPMTALHFSGNFVNLKISEDDQGNMIIIPEKISSLENMYDRRLSSFKRDPRRPNDFENIYQLYNESSLGVIYSGNNYNKKLLSTASNLDHYLSEYLSQYPSEYPLTTSVNLHENWVNDSNNINYEFIQTKTVPYSKEDQFVNKVDVTEDISENTLFTNKLRANVQSKPDNYTIRDHIYFDSINAGNVKARALLSNRYDIANLTNLEQGNLQENENTLEGQFHIFNLFNWVSGITINCNNPTYSTQLSRSAYIDMTNKSPSSNILINDIFSVILGSESPNTNPFVYIRDLTTGNDVLGSFYVVCGKDGIYRLKFLITISYGINMKAAAQVCSAEIVCLKDESALPEQSYLVNFENKRGTSDDILSFLDASQRLFVNPIVGYIQHGRQSNENPAIVNLDIAVKKDLDSEDIFHPETLEKQITTNNFSKSYDFPEAHSINDAMATSLPRNDSNMLNKGGKYPTIECSNAIYESTARNGTVFFTVLDYGILPPLHSVGTRKILSPPVAKIAWNSDDFNTSSVLNILTFSLSSDEAGPSAQLLVDPRYSFQCDKPSVTYKYFLISIIIDADNTISRRCSATLVCS